MALRTTVHAAEQMAGDTIQEVVINLSGGYPASQTVGVEVPISGREVADHDLHRVLMQGAQVHGPVDRRLIHSIPVSYSIDGSKGIRDPLLKQPENVHGTLSRRGVLPRKLRRA